MGEALSMVWDTRFISHHLTAPVMLSVEVLLLLQASHWNYTCHVRQADLTDVNQHVEVILLVSSELF